MTRAPVFESFFKLNPSTSTNSTTSTNSSAPISLYRLPIWEEPRLRGDDDMDGLMEEEVPEFELDANGKRVMSSDAVVAEVIRRLSAWQQEEFIKKLDGDFSQGLTLKESAKLAATPAPSQQSTFQQ